MGVFTTRIPYCLLICLTLCFLSNISNANHGKQQQLPSAMMVGTVFCDTCFHQEFSENSHFISGALVAVECGDTRTPPSFRKEARTNKHGVFRVRLPSQIGKHLERIKGCTVKLIDSGEPFCAVASSATSSSLSLKSRKRGLHIFSAGFFTFKPLQQPELCYQKPGPAKAPKFGSEKFFATYPTFPALVNLPPLPQLPPLPSLPRLPNLPSLGGAGEPNQTKLNVSPNPNMVVDQKQGQPAFFPQSPLVPLLPLPPTSGGIPLPRNPFQPPQVLPPNPFQQPPSVMPPLPFQPPGPPFIYFPPIPGLTPQSPPPPVFRFPRLPFPRNPPFPGNPLSVPSKTTTP